MADVQTVPTTKERNLMFPTEIKGLKAARAGQYISKATGDMMFRFIVTGPIAAMAAYKKARGEYFVEDAAAGGAVYNVSQRQALQIVKAGGRLIISVTGQINADYDALEDALVEDELYIQARASERAKADIAATAGRTKRVYGAARTAPVEPANDLSNPENHQPEPEMTDEEKAALNIV